MKSYISDSIWEKRDPKIHMRYDDRHFAMSTSRRFFIGLVLYLLVSSLFMFIAGLLLSVFAPEIFKAINKSELFLFLLDSFSMYVIGTGVLCLTIKGTNVRRREKKHFEIENMIILFFIGQFFTVAGNLLGNLISFIITALTGSNAGININQSFADIPLWCFFLIVVVIGPIFEELVFRKLMIDRFSVYGDKLAIIVSSVAFGLFHGNFIQFFYTASVGLIWGYIYTKSGKLRYPVIMHMMMNFIGGFVPTYAATGHAIAVIFSTAGLLVMQYAAAIAGFVLFIIAIAKKWYTVGAKSEVYIPKKHLPRFLIFNIGAILFLISCIIRFALNYFPSLLEKIQALL